MSAFGIINAGDACAELDGRIWPASRCCWISVAHASLYLRGVLYDRVVKVLVASFSFILQYTSVGKSSRWGIGAKTSLYLVLTDSPSRIS